MNSKEIKDYIKKEKNLSKFKLKILKERIYDKSFSREIYDQEKKFILYDFDKINFSSLKDCRSALYLFKKSFNMFEQKYTNKKIVVSFDEIFAFLEKEIEGISVKEDMIGGSIIPNVSNRSLYNKDGSCRSFVHKITLKQKILLNCLIKCFNNLMKYSKEFKFEEIDYFLETIKNNIYKYYNDSFRILYDAKLITEKEKSKFKPLSSAIPLYEDMVLINEKKYMKLSMPHSGFEKINPLYINIKNENGSTINLFHKFKVILHKDVYYKSVELSSESVFLDNSEILIASTRREMEDFINLKSWLKEKIETIKTDFIK